jgi:hypothetical protein
LAITIVVAVASLIWPSLGLPLNSQQFPPYAVTLLWTFIGIGVTLYFAVLEIGGGVERTYPKVAEDMSALRLVVQQSMSWEYLGHTNDIVTKHFDALKKQASVAEEVKNTLILFDLSDARVEEYLNLMRSGEDGKNIAADKRILLAKEVLDRGKEWKDIFSEQVVAAKNSYVRNVIENLRKVSSYHVSVLKEAYPAVNMLLFKGEPSEVWLGFGLFRGHEMGHVFKSRDPNLCVYFDKYWDALHSDSDDELGALRRTDILGAWTTEAYSEYGSVHDYAALYIRLDGHELSLKGWSFDPNFDRRVEFSSIAAHFGSSGKGKGKALRYAYREQDVSATGDVSSHERTQGGGGDITRLEREGGGLYHFSKKNPDVFDGEFFAKNGKAYRLAGRRVDGQDALVVMSEEVDLEGIRDLISRRYKKAA